MTEAEFWAFSILIGLLIGWVALERYKRQRVERWYWMLEDRVRDLEGIVVP